MAVHAADRHPRRDIGKVTGQVVERRACEHFVTVEISGLVRAAFPHDGLTGRNRFQNMGQPILQRCFPILLDELF